MELELELELDSHKDIKLFYLYIAISYIWSYLFIVKKNRVYIIWWFFSLIPIDYFQTSSFMIKIKLLLTTVDFFDSKNIFNNKLFVLIY